MTNTDYSEDTLVEQPAIALFSKFGYRKASMVGKEFVETVDNPLVAGRYNTTQVTA